MITFPYNTVAVQLLLCPLFSICFPSNSFFLPCTCHSLQRCKSILYWTWSTNSYFTIFLSLQSVLWTTYSLLWSLHPPEILYSTQVSPAANTGRQGQLNQPPYPPYIEPSKLITHLPVCSSYLIVLLQHLLSCYFLKIQHPNSINASCCEQSYTDAMFFLHWFQYLLCRCLHRNCGQRFTTLTNHYNIFIRFCKRVGQVQSCTQCLSCIKTFAKTC